MKRFRCWLVGAILGLLLGLLAAWLFTDPILRRVIERGVRRQAGVETTLGGLHFCWTSARLRLENLQLKNPPEFGGGLLLSVPTLAVNLDAGDLWHGRLHFRDLRLHVAEFNLVRSRAGQLNFRLPGKPPPDTNAPARSGPPPVRHKPAEGFEFGGIDRLELTLGRLTYTDQRHPENSSELDFGVHQEVVTNLQTTEETRCWLAALLVRVAIQDYLLDPAKSRSRLRDMLFRGLKRM